MAKRKRDVSTVRGADPNWLEASEEVSAVSELDCGSAETHKDGSKGQKVANGDQTPKATSNGAYVGLPTQQGVTPRVQVVGATSAAPNRDGLVGKGVTNQLTASSSDQFGSSWSTEAIGWLGVAKVPDSEVTASTEAVPAEELEERHNQTLNAFWELLKRAGYEEL